MRTLRKKIAVVLASALFALQTMPLTGAMAVSDPADVPVDTEESDESVILADTEESDESVILTDTEAEDDVEVPVMVTDSEDEMVLPENAVDIISEDDEELSGGEYILNYRGEEEPEIASIEESLNAGLIFGDVERVNASNLPSSYKTPYITSVKDQGSYGTCWAHACVGAAESNLYKQGIASSTIDLSEWHLAYFVYHSVTDPLGGTAGDSFSISASEEDDYLDIGGNQVLASYTIANWKGLVGESVAPYDTITADRTKVLSDSLAYKNDLAHLKNAYWISMRDMDYVKTALQKYGAAAVSFNANDTYFNQVNKHNCTEPLATYCPDSLGMGTNHGVVLVGWDDNFSKDNFGPYKPSSDGAWLCKNSWGSTFGQDGLFWISYEDGPLNNINAYFYEMAPSDDYTNNYQYDGSCISAYYNSCAYEANVYTASSNQTLKAVGFYTADISYNYTVYVYKNCESGSPKGTLMAKQSGSQLYAGFHTVKLSREINLKKGETFSIVIKQTTADGSDPRLGVDVSSSGSWYEAVSASKTGQSYIGTDSYWWDISKPEMGYNCRIKAYTDTGLTGTSDPLIIKVSKVKLSKTDLSLKTGKTATLTATVSPDDATNKNVKWKSSNTAVATVSSSGKITAKKAGTATITCTAADGSGIKTTCKVTVIQPVTKIALNNTSRTILLGKTMNLKATVSPSDASNKKITWKSSNTSVATVNSSGKVTAKRVGTAKITCTAADGSGKKAICKVTVARPVTKIALNKTSATVYADYKITLTAKATPGNATNKNVKWKSSNTKVATVNSKGVVTGVKTGTVTITCTAADGSGVKKTCKITVKEYNQTQKFIARLYKKCLDRDPDASGMAHWYQLIMTKQRTPEQVAESFFGSAEFRAKNLSNEEYIKTLYRAFMGREADAAGLSHWVGELNRGCTREEILHRFATSQEFKKIQSSFGL